ncbi:MAG: hypothetical protein CMI69_00190 [Candidatus Pelagibacter sp.]|nr:hypothetical protein [Candidatus Pelagibacter sp.]
MKRLLAYLFIVLGLGLVFSANGNASRNDCSGETSKNKTVINYYYEFNRLDFLSDQEILSNSYKDFFISDQRVLLGKNKYQQNNKIPKGYKCISGDKYVSRIKEYKKKRKDLKIIINFKEKLITRIVALGGKPKIDTFEINSDNDIIVLRKQLEDLREPSQTQEVAKLQNSDIINTAWILDSRYFVLFLKNEKCKFNDKGLDSIIRNLNYEGSWGISCKYKLYSNNRVELEHDLFNYPVKLYLAFSNNTFVGSIGSGFQGLEKILSGKKQPNVKGVKKELTPLQIAKLPKTEPSQTQEVATKEPDDEGFWGTVYGKNKFTHTGEISIAKGCEIAKERAINKALTKYPNVQGEIISTSILDLKKFIIKSDSGDSIFICEVDISAYIKYTKKEPSQTQLISICFDKDKYGSSKKIRLHYSKNDYLKSSHFKSGKCNLIVEENRNNKLFKKLQNKVFVYARKLDEYASLTNKIITIVDNNKNFYEQIYLNQADKNISKWEDLYPIIQTQIAKTEPSQTQEVASKEINTNDQFEMYSILNSSGINRIFSGCTINQWCGRNDPKFIVSMLLLENGKCRFGNKPDGLIKSYNYEGSFDRPCKYKINKYDKNTIHFEIGSGQRIANIKINKITLEASGVPLSYLSSYPKTVTRFKKEEVLNIAKKYEINNLVTKITGSANNQTQIAKTEPTITPKKKVAKTTQEIFKPEDKDIDNDPPRIEIAEAITVVSQSYTIKGIVKDKSKPIYLEINGRPIEVKNNKFELERFNIDPDVVEELKIVAIDQWNNRSEKIVKVTVELQSTEVVRTYEELKPNRVKVKMDKDKIAIIIGIEKYENLINLDAKYANRDAQAFRTYATKALGIKPSNIKVLIDDKANRGNTLEAFKLWLPKIANNDGKDIYVFFAGHGLASENGEDLYILPQDGNAKLLDDTAITRVELISLIQKVNPKSVTMFFDTCYSGQTRDERMLVASLLRPIRIVADEQETPDNFTIFSASNFDQASGGIEEAKHGMFSYYLMKGLEGKADNNKDKQITNGELIAYLKTNVSKEAFTQNRKQDPMLSGDPDQVLMSYR